MGKAKRSSPSWPAEFSQDFCKNSITLLPRHQYKHLTHNWSYLNTSLKLPFKTLLWFCSCMVISRLITTVSWGPNCPSFNLHHVTLSMWQLMWSMTSPLNIQASSGLLQLFPTIQLPPCSTKELKTHCQNHDKELFVCRVSTQKLESTKVSFFAEILFVPKTQRSDTF